MTVVAEGRTCASCGEYKEADAFSPDPRMKSGLSSYCKPCRTAYGARHRDANRDRVQELSRARYANRTPEKIAETKQYERERSLARHGLTPETYAGILDDQGNCCAICGAVTAGGKGSWHVDHDHSCCPGTFSCGSCVRGLLCHRCNTAIGLMGDDPDWAMKAAFYLKEGK